MQELNLPAAYSLLSRIHANQKNNGKGISLTLIVCQKRFRSCFSGQKFLGHGSWLDIFHFFAHFLGIFDTIFCSAFFTIPNS